MRRFFPLLVFLLVFVGLGIAGLKFLLAPRKVLSTFDRDHYQLMPKIGITPKQLAEAEIVCTGHFLSTKPTTESPAELTIGSPSQASYTYRNLRRTIFPFAVDHYWKGNGPATLDVARFKGPHVVEPFLLFPQAAEGRLVLLLKRDATGSNAWQFVDIMNSWTAISDHALADIPPDTSLEKAMEAAGLESLESFVDSLPTPPPPGNNLDPSVTFLGYSAIGILENFASNDASTIQALEKFYLNQPLDLVLREREAFMRILCRLDSARATRFGLDQLDSGLLAQNERDQVIAAYIELDPLAAYQQAVKHEAENSFPCEDRLFYARSLSRFIKKPKIYAQMDPAFIQKMIVGDAAAQQNVCNAFYELGDDPHAIPWLGQFLDSPDPGVQFRAMRGLFYFIRKQNPEFPPPPDPESSSHAQPFPEHVVRPYKAAVKRWLAQYPSYAIPPAP